MKNIITKKLLHIAGAAAVTIGLSIGASTFAQTIETPTNDTVWQWLGNNGITEYSGSSYMSTGITREMAANMMVEFMNGVGNDGTTTGIYDPSVSTCVFSDFNNANPDLVNSIRQICDLGLIKGDNGNFYPTQSFTKAQAVAVLVRYVEGFQDETTDPWWENYFNKAKTLGLTTEVSSSGWDTAVTMDDMAALLYRTAYIVNPSTTDTNSTIMNNDMSGTTDSSSGIFDMMSGFMDDTTTDLSGNNDTALSGSMDNTSTDMSGTIYDMSGDMYSGTYYSGTVDNSLSGSTDSLNGNVITSGTNMSGTVNDMSGTVNGLSGDLNMSGSTSSEVTGSLNNM